jgi:hypothetical protein
VQPCLLVVESDLGFAFWLAKVLDGAGCQTFPARDVPAAFVLLRDVAGLESNVRIIIVGDGQMDADRLIAHCRQRSPDLNVVVLSPGAAAAPQNGDLAPWSTPGQPTDDCRELLVAIGRLLASR